jgi:hypothetical protein
MTAMSIDATETPSGECAAGRDERQARVAPLLAAGLTIRAISAETGIPVGAVHRAKRRIEKARTRQPPSEKPPPSLLTQRVINGIGQDVRRLTIWVYEHKVNAAVWRGLLEHGKRGDAGAVIGALFAACFSDRTIHWLHQRGFLQWDNRGRGEAISAAVNELIERQR